MGGFDTQVKTAQQVLAEALKQVFELCFEMDEKLFGNYEKTVRGVDAGAPYEVTYTPKKDIDAATAVRRAEKAATTAAKPLIANPEGN